MQEPNIQSLGGAARAEKLTAGERTSIAAKAAAARWSVPRAICGAADKPLRIGDIEIPCYVLENEKRVLVQGGILSALNLSIGGSGAGSGYRLARFASQERFTPFISKEIRESTLNPIYFRLPSGTTAYGYEADILAELCFAVLEAGRRGKLQKQQEHIIERAEVLVRGFSKVGIIALVDEATGYQEYRVKDALARILEQYIAKDLQPYAPTFPLEFYRQIFRLKGWDFDPKSWKRPSVIGHYTNYFIYKRLAPGVLDELRKKNPKIEGRRKHKFFQWLTGEIGHPKLLAHFEGVMALMKISDSFPEFRGRLKKIYPKFVTTELGFTVEIAES